MPMPGLTNLNTLYNSPIAALPVASASAYNPMPRAPYGPPALLSNQGTNLNKHNK